MLLNLVEVAKSHLGLNLAAVFATILDEFDISIKVLTHIDVARLLDSIL